MTELAVPNHIAEERKKAREEAARSDVDKAYVKTEDRVLDPTLLDKSLLERMPDPVGWRILVLPYRGKGQTEGEIALEPGKYTLQAVFADYSHMTHNPPVVSDFIEIIVE